MQLFDPELRRFRRHNLAKDHSFPRGTLQREIFPFFLQRATLTRTDNSFTLADEVFVEQKSKFFLSINHSKYSVEISKDTVTRIL